MSYTVVLMVKWYMEKLLATFLAHNRYLINIETNSCVNYMTDLMLCTEPL